MQILSSYWLTFVCCDIYIAWLADLDKKLAKKSHGKKWYNGSSGGFITIQPMMAQPPPPPQHIIHGNVNVINQSAAYGIIISAETENLRNKSLM